MAEEGMGMEESWLERWRVVIIMSLASFVIVLDTSMINVAVPAIVKELKTTVPGVQAAISFYALVMAAFMLAGGKVCRRLRDATGRGSARPMVRPRFCA